MKLHYSQTHLLCFVFLITFYYLMKLHYSQTPCSNALHALSVLLPYEITLFSNVYEAWFYIQFVLLPYEITLFSNEGGNDND